MPNVESSNNSSLYINGLIPQIGKDNIVFITQGQCRDLNNFMDIVVGATNVQNFLMPNDILINPNINGAGGLDTGVLEADTLYAVFVLADSSYNKPTSGILSKETSQIPLLPAGYDTGRLVGYLRTGDDGNFLLNQIVVGSGSERKLIYNDYVQVLTNGSSTSTTSISLENSVASFGRSETNLAIIGLYYIPNNYVNSYVYIGPDSDSLYIPIVGQQSDTICYGQCEVPCPPSVSEDGNQPRVFYSVSSSSDTLDIFVEGFYFTV